jgi:hypothetical protein
MGGDDHPGVQDAGQAASHHDPDRLTGVGGRHRIAEPGQGDLAVRLHPWRHPAGRFGGAMAETSRVRDRSARAHRPVGGRPPHNWCGRPATAPGKTLRRHRPDGIHQRQGQYRTGLRAAQFNRAAIPDPRRSRKVVPAMPWPGRLTCTAGIGHPTIVRSHASRRQIIHSSAVKRLAPTFSEPRVTLVQARCAVAAWGAIMLGEEQARQLAPDARSRPKPSCSLQPCQAAGPAVTRRY